MQEDKLTLKQLKVNLKDALKKSGVIDNVKAQIRKEFITSLDHNLNKVKGKAENFNLEFRIISSLIHHYFKYKRFSSSLSVFSAESGLDSHAALSEIDIINAMHIGNSTSLYKAFVEKIPASVTSTSLLEAFISDIGRRGHHEVENCSTQTDTCGPSARESLDSNIRLIASNYSMKIDEEKITPLRSVEERMHIFQRDVEERYRRELHAQINIMRETEISKMRLEESQHARSALDVLRRELEEEYQRRIQSHTRREAESVQHAAERERQLQQAQYDYRQKMQQELDDLRNREVASTRKSELEMQGLRILESRLKESQMLLDCRENEIARRERDLEGRSKQQGEQARIEAKAHLQSELDLLMRERAAVKLERSRLDEDRALAAAQIDDVADLRRQLRDVELARQQLEDEKAGLRLRLQRMENVRREEEKELEEISRTTSITFGTSKSFASHLMAMAQAKVELDVRLELLQNQLRVVTQERDDLKRKLQGKNSEKVDISLHTAKWNQERSQLVKDKELINRALLIEKSKVSSLSAELNELKKLAVEQREALKDLEVAEKPHRRRKDRAHSKDRHQPTSRPPPPPAIDWQALLQAAALAQQFQQVSQQGEIQTILTSPQASSFSSPNIDFNAMMHAIANGYSQVTRPSNGFQVVQPSSANAINRDIPALSVQPLYPNEASRAVPTPMALESSLEVDRRLAEVRRNVGLGPALTAATAAGCTTHDTGPGNLVSAVSGQLSNAESLARKLREREEASRLEELQRMEIVRKEQELQLQREALVRADMEDERADALRRQQLEAEMQRMRDEAEAARRKLREDVEEVERRRLQQEAALAQQKRDIEEKQRIFEEERAAVASPQMIGLAEIPRPQGQGSMNVVDTEVGRPENILDVEPDRSPSPKTSSNTPDKENIEEVVTPTAQEAVPLPDIEETSASAEELHRVKQETEEQERQRREQEEEERARMQRAKEAEDAVRRKKEELAAAKAKILAKKRQKKSTVDDEPEEAPAPVAQRSRGKASWLNDASDDEVEGNRLDDSGEGNTWL